MPLTTNYHEINDINAVLFNVVLSDGTEDIRAFQIPRGKKPIRTIELVSDRPWLYRPNPGAGGPQHLIPAYSPLHLELGQAETIIGITRVDAADTMVSCLVVG